MDFLKELTAYLAMHGPAIVAMVFAVLTAAEMIVRLTPTKKDDGAIERIGHWIRWFFEVLRVPNIKSGGGDHPTLEDKEDMKQL